MTGSSQYGHMYAPLRTPNFRMFITGQTVSTIGTLVQMTAQSWVVYQLTHSPAALGWVTMLGSLPMLLLGPFAGSIADRVPRRTLLIGTQAILGSLAAILAILVQTDVIQIWHIYVLAVITGIVTAIDMPALQAFAADLTGTAMIRQAVTLNSMAFQLARIVGPSLAGLLIGYSGTATVLGKCAQFCGRNSRACSGSVHRQRRDTTDGPARRFHSWGSWIKRRTTRSDLVRAVAADDDRPLSVFDALRVFRFFHNDGHAGVRCGGSSR